MCLCWYICIAICRFSVDRRIFGDSANLSHFISLVPYPIGIQASNHQDSCRSFQFLWEVHTNTRVVCVIHKCRIFYVCGRGASPLSLIFSGSSTPPTIPILETTAGMDNICCVMKLAVFFLSLSMANAQGKGKGKGPWMMMMTTKGKGKGKKGLIAKDQILQLS